MDVSMLVRRKGRAFALEIADIVRRFIGVMRRLGQSRSRVSCAQCAFEQRSAGISS
jgi:hypothetical protein